MKRFAASKHRLKPRSIAGEMRFVGRICTCDKPTRPSPNRQAEPCLASRILASRTAFPLHLQNFSPSRPSCRPALGVLFASCYCCYLPSYALLCARIAGHAAQTTDCTNARLVGCQKVLLRPSKARRAGMGWAWLTETERLSSHGKSWPANGGKHTWYSTVLVPTEAGLS